MFEFCTKSQNVIVIKVVGTLLLEASMIIIQIDIVNCVQLICSMLEWNKRERERKEHRIVDQLASIKSRIQAEKLTPIALDVCSIGYSMSMAERFKATWIFIYYFAVWINQNRKIRLEFRRFVAHCVINEQDKRANNVLVFYSILLIYYTFILITHNIYLVENI